MLKFKSAFLIAACAFVLLAVTTPLRAQDNSVPPYICIRLTNFHMRSGNNPGDCKKNEISISWNQLTRAYITHADFNNVKVIDTSSNTIVATIAVGLFPSGVYLATYNGNNVKVIDAASNTVVSTISVGSTPTNMAIK